MGGRQAQADTQLAARMAKLYLLQGRFHRFCRRSPAAAISHLGAAIVSPGIRGSEPRPERYAMGSVTKGNWGI